MAHQNFLVSYAFVVVCGVVDGKAEALVFSKKSRRKNLYGPSKFFGVHG